MTQEVKQEREAVAVFEVTFSQQELEKFTELASWLEQDFPSTVRMCMNERCDDLLDTFYNNTPQEEAKQHKVDTAAYTPSTLGNLGED